MIESEREFEMRKRALVEKFTTNVVDLIEDTDSGNIKIGLTGGLEFINEVLELIAELHITYDFD